VIAGLGAGPLVSLVPDAIVGAAPPEQAGSAASISSTSADFGGALGVASLGSIGVFVYRLAMAGEIPPGVPTWAAQISRGTLGGAVAVSQGLPPHVAAALTHAARGAFTSGFVTVAVISAVLMIAAAIMMATVVEVA
jgi:DHA2 family multidrug resistance protein-like MFS transporter